MYQSTFRFVAIVSQGERQLLRRDLGDFLPCYEDLLFSAVCAGCLENNGSRPVASVDPVWPEKGGPGIEGFQLSLPQFSKRYRLSVFANSVLAEVQASALAESRTEDSIQFTWHVEAERKEEVVERRVARAQVRSLSKPYPFSIRSLTDFGIENEAVSSEPFVLYLASSLEREMKSEAARWLDCEKAGLLAGHLIWQEGRNPSLVVTRRVPAERDSSSSRSHFSFSPLTFVAAQQELARQPEAGICVGWHHNHPPPCGRECLMHVPACGTRMAFFSNDDHNVHRAGFAAPYQVALVCAKDAERRADDPILTAYGWKDGTIEKVPFTVF